MAKHLLVTGAGTGTTNNLLRSLRAGDLSLFTVGCHYDRFILKQSSADRNYLTPAATEPRYADALRRVIETERVDLVLPTSDPDVRQISALRDDLPCSTFLPSKAVIELCQDKYELATFLRARGIPAPRTYQVTDPAEVEELYRRLAPPSRVWCRTRTGSGALAAAPVTSPAQARTWIEYWAEARGIPATSFTLCEYLPGRDFSCQSLWTNGALVIAKTYERLAYFTGGAQPGGVSSVAALAKTVSEPRVVEVCRSAIGALCDDACGVFSVDLKADADGVPCITEINAGRFSMSTNLHDLTGAHNLALTYVRLALGDPVELRDAYEVAEDYYMVRDLDILPGVFQAEEFFEGIEDART